MSTNTRPLPTAAALGRGLRGALQWRLLLLWALATLVCALIGALPAWGWLGTLFGHSVHATAVAGGEAPALVLEALTQRDAPMSLLGASSMGAGLLMLVLSPLLVGATVSAIRARTRLGFGDLLRGGIGEYGPMLRMLLWSAVPLGIALAAGSGILAANAAAHKQAVVAAELDAGRYAAMAVGGVLFVLAHASLEAGHKLAWHTGGWPGQVSRLTLVPGRKLGVIVLTSAELGVAFNAVTYRALDMMLDREGNDWLKAYAAAYAKSQADADTSWQKHLAARAANSTPSLALAKYAGTYRDPWYGDVVIKSSAKGLEMQFSKTAELLGDIEHWQHDSFIVRWRDRSLNADAFVNFALDADGKIREMRMQPVSPLTDFSFDFQDLRLAPVPVK